MISYKKLFHKDSNNNIRVWYMEQDGDKYRTVSGILDGKLVTSEWTFPIEKNIGKSNQTSAELQAKSEIESRYKKQLKLKYFENVDDVEGTKIIAPMLAKEYKDYKNKIDLTTKQFAVQVKLNGNRCVATINGLFSRKGEQWLNCDHIKDELKSFFEINPTAVLDGEFYNFDLRQNLNELTSIVRKTKNITVEERLKSQDMVQYHVYDFYDGNENIPTKNYIQRFDWLMDNLPKNNNIKLLEYETIENEHHLTDIYNRVIESGEEGLIIRNLNSPYEIGKRSKHLLKYKPVDSSEAKIIALHKGTGNWGNVFKTCTLLWNDIQFDATFKGSNQELLGMIPEQWVNKTVTFLYNGLTGLNTPNFARIDIKNCFSGDR